MPFEMEVVGGRLQTIADEMQLTLLRSAYSNIIKEGWDASAALFSVDGETLVQATAIPAHLGSLVPAVRRILEVFPCQQMHPGDLFALNDPYDGGTHLPDIITVSPIFDSGNRVCALAATIAHHQDVGGMTPGSTPTDARELFQEGIVVPPIRLVHRGRIEKAIWELLKRNVRLPTVLEGDLRAQMAAAYVGAKGFRSLVDEYGRERIEGTCDQLLKLAEKHMRSMLRTVPDGDYTFTDFLDNDGVNLGERLRITVQLHVRGSEANVTFDGTSSQCVGPLNAVPGSTAAAVWYPFRALLGPDVPNNSGCYRPIEIYLPEDSLVNPTRPAAVNARTSTLKRVSDAVFGALSIAVPGTVPAASSGVLLALSMGGVDPSSGKYFVVLENVDGGSGASSLGNGVSALSTDMTNAMNTPVEALELSTPLRVSYCRLRDQSAGSGLFSGGLGTEKEYVVLRGHIVVSHRGERFFSEPWGLDGGQPGARSYGIVIRNDGDVYNIPSKAVLLLKQGDKLRVGTPGGGGYGSAGGSQALLS